MLGGISCNLCSRLFTPPAVKLLFGGSCLQLHLGLFSKPHPILSCNDVWCAVEHERLVVIGSWLRCASSRQRSQGLMGLTSAWQRGFPDGSLTTAIVQPAAYCRNTRSKLFCDCSPCRQCAASFRRLSEYLLLVSVGLILSYWCSFFVSSVELF